VGNFYVNFSVKAAEPKRVADVLRSAGRVALVTPAQRGAVVVYEEEADTQATGPILDVGALLSRAVDAPVLAVLNHDDDILCYWLFERGALVDAYNSRPDYFGGAGEQGGDARRLCDVWGGDPVLVEAVLRSEHTFALQQHQQLAEALGLPLWSVGFGYRYVTAGELMGVFDEGELIRTD
jgi:hypothetical protein